jgi:hypothetical protein
MKKILLLVTALAVTLCLGEASVFAQRGGGGQGGGAGVGGQGAGGGAGAMGGGAGGGRGIGGSGGGGGFGSRGGSTGRGGNSGDRAGNSTGMRETGSSLGKQSPTDILSKSPQLSSRLQSLLPAGTNLTDAASGFKNLGQFVAAVHVSHNLDIPFNDLKDKMTSGDNLGKAIKELDPNVKAKAEAKKAEKQSKSDLNKAASEAN